MRVAIASDHAGFDQKGPIVRRLREEGYDVVDLGPISGGAATTQTLVTRSAAMSLPARPSAELSSAVLGLASR